MELLVLPADFGSGLETSQFEEHDEPPEALGRS